ncbi:MAG: AIR synthase [Lachnospiraceae bacterium]|nr:AIR synthase [Lachnospiraceae bacterium]
MVRPPERECTGRMEPGEDLVVVGCIGQQGMKALVQACRDQLSPWFSGSYLQEIADSREPDVQAYRALFTALGATEAEAAGEGGILKAIWDLSSAYRVGVTFQLRRIPVRQQTIEVCERCGCNPYRLWCGNCLVLAAENGGRIVEACGERGILAAVIGSVKEGIAKEIHHGDEVGYLERPREDELCRLLGRGALDALVPHP